jgi:hypothetical protein
MAINVGLLRRLSEQIYAALGPKAIGKNKKIKINFIGRLATAAEIAFKTGKWCWR